MKVTWEDDDIISGRRFGRKGIKEVHIIGYIVPKEGKNIITVTSLEDGNVWYQGTAPFLAMILNENDYLPVELLNQ